MDNDAASEALVPLTSAQFTVLVEHLIRPSGLAYNQPLIAEIPGEVSLQTYRGAVNSAARRCEMLFSRYHYVNGEAGFTIGVPHEIDVVVYDTQAEAAASFVSPFDLNRDPLLRAGMVRYDGHVTCLLIDFHHIATDGVSIGFFSKQLAEALAGKPFSRVYRTLVDYITWATDDLAHRAARERSNALLKESIAAGVRRTPWPSSFVQEDQGPTAELGYAVHRFHLDPALSRRIKDRALATRQTAFKLCYLAFLATHASVAARTDITSAFVASGRTGHPFFDAYGMLSKTVLLAARLDRERTLAATLALLSHDINTALESQELSSESLLRSLAKATGERALVDALFVFQNIAFLKQPVLGGYFRSFCEGRKEVQFGMVVHVFDRGTPGYEIHWEYSPKRYSPDAVREFARKFENLVAELARVDLEVRLGELIDGPVLATTVGSEIPELDFS